MTTSVLSIYYSPTHWYAQDEDYIRRLQPAWVRIHQPTARAIHTVQRLSPDSKIMLRSWDIDDSDGNRKREMYADPKGAARKHLEMWKAKWEELEAELKRNGWAYDTNRWYLGLVNEPDPAYVPQTVAYSLEAMRLIEYRDIRLGVVCSSVGTFSKPSENGNGWALCKPLEKPINDGGHILIAHEYWQPEGPNYGEDAGNLAWRHRSIPLDVPILIGEAGANGYIYGRYSKEDDSGWQKTVKDPKPETFAAQVKEYIEGCDSRVQGVCLYMLDFHSDQWWSFNTGPAMEQLLAIKDARPQAASPFAKPIETHLPIIQNGKPVAIVDAPAGANIRSGPGMDYPVLGVEVYGTEMPVMGRNGDWWMVDLPHVQGWVHGMIVRTFNVGGVPVRSEVFGSLPSDPMNPAHWLNNWDRAWPIVLRIEGGLSLDPNDSGNYYQGKLVGTKFGISAAVWGGQYDIPNLTKEQALAIYRKHYWEAADCDQLPWPMCLIHFDTAVQHGVGVANEILNSLPTREQAYLGLRALRYMDDPKWRLYGEAWGIRVDHLNDIAKESN